jgi:hypothetical protein
MALVPPERLGTASTCPRGGPAPKSRRAFIMTALDNLRIRKLQLEQHLRQGLSEEQREQIEGELIKIDIAISFLDEPVKTPTDRQGKAADRKNPPA